MRRSHRSVVLFATLLVAITAALGSPALQVGAAPAAPLVISGPADVLSPAQRLRPLPPVNFPMQVTPRCLILNNFGAPRSGGRHHEGEDIMATLGQEVYAMADGTLTWQAMVGDGRAGTALSGNAWKLTVAGGGTYFIYAHLSLFAPGLTKGSVVFKGQVLGYVGDTGDAGPGNYHLHFEWHPGGGAAVDPLPLLTVPPQCRVA